MSTNWDTILLHRWLCPAMNSSSPQRRIRGVSPKRMSSPKSTISSWTLNQSQLCLSKTPKIFQLALSLTINPHTKGHSRLKNSAKGSKQISTRHLIWSPSIRIPSSMRETITSGGRYQSIQHKTVTSNTMSHHMRCKRIGFKKSEAKMTCLLKNTSKARTI